MIHIKRLNEYFELTRTTTHKINLYEFIESSKDSGVFKVDCTTGNNEFGKIYRRVYTFEINNFDGNTLSFYLSSKDYAPSGFGKSDTEIEFGNFELKFTDKEFNDNAKNALKNVLSDIDKDFWIRYKMDDKNIKVISNGSNKLKF
ncbi:MAG: hypothetical protein IKO56_01215 [Alphaproteobacteria bacterium]|nr:hypothetical protein [Alphaproteobacteria bacterium]